MASFWNQIFEMNDFGKFFIRAKEHTDVTKGHFEDANAQGASAQEVENLMNFASVAGGNYSQQTIDFSPVLNSKKGRIQMYREMAMSPEIDDGVTNILNDTVKIDETSNKIYDLQFLDRSDKEIPDVVKQRIRNAYEYIYYEILNFNQTAQEFCRRFLVDGEIYNEWILNSKGTNLIGYQPLPAFTIVPIYSDRGNRISGYVQLLTDVINYNQRYDWNDNKPKSDAIFFQSNQITYCAYPGQRGGNRLDVRGYLEPAIRTYNLLRAVEDSVVIYRLVRAPEKRVWNIYTAGLPPAKASEYINGLQKKYKKKLVYDSMTGQMDQTLRTQNMLEDFWFAKGADGQSSTVETLQSGMNLGEITDLDFLQKKLYKSLKLPASRWADPSSQYTGGKIGEVTREEVRFSQFINSSIHPIFKRLLLEPLFLVLKLRGIDEKYISETLINIKPTKSNYFEDYLRLDIVSTKLGVFQTVSDKIWSPDTPTNPWHMDTVLEDLCGFSQDMIDKNKKRIEDAIKNAKALTSEGGDETPPEGGMEESPPEDQGIEMPEEMPTEANPEAVAQEAESIPEATPEGMGMQPEEPTT